MEEVLCDRKFPMGKTRWREGGTYSDIFCNLYIKIDLMINTSKFL